MKIFSIKSGIINECDSILKILLNLNIDFQEKDILAISSKVVALSQNRILNISDYGLNKKEAIKKLIYMEADKVYEGKYLLTIKDNILIPFAGIDASNVPKGKLILWPKNAYKYAKNIQEKISKKYKINDFGVLITDSHCQPLRKGVTGLALAWYGFRGVVDLRGKKDLFGKKLKVTQKAVADSLAVASVYVKGECDESTPFAIIRDSNAIFDKKDDYIINSYIDIDDDIFKSVMKL